MAQATSQKLKGWDGKLATPRIKGRDDYYGGPKAGPEIYTFYEKFLDRITENVANPTVLVMGATPELRDLVLSRNINLIVVDLSTMMLEDMKVNMVHANHPKEKTIAANWLEIPIPDNSVDVVMGDAISNNIPVPKHGDLFNEIKRVLKPGGHLLMRELMLDPTHPRLTLKEIAQNSREENWHKYDLFFELYLYSSDGGYQPENEWVDLAKYAKRLETEIYSQNLISPEDETWLKKFCHGDVKTTFITEEEWLKTYQRYFELLETAKPRDFRFCDYFYFFLGRKAN